MNKEDLVRQIIIDHYNTPHNRVTEAPTGYQTIKGVNPSCGDELELYLKIDGKNNIVDVKWKGEGCSICCSSTSVLTEEIKGIQSQQELQNKIIEFQKLLQGSTEYNEDLFEDAIAYEGISKFPARYKCAFLSWDTLLKYIEER